MCSNALEASTFTMPEGAAVWEDARDFGAGWGNWKIPFGGWRFTCGDVGWTNGFAWVEGYFRARFNSRANEIRLLSDRLALCPAANWSRYNLAASRAWSATNDVGELVVTFENAAIADDPTKIASVQMELFPRTGEVALRYDLANVGDATYTAGLVVDGTNHFVEVGAGTREVVFQRVHPDDWDMDGLPNTIDGNPRVPSPTSGYNQSDAWAMAAFPSNATEIATMGYTAWATARAADPNRRLIAFTLASKNNTWPVCLTFGDVQVMCDGTEQIVFPIDCGARYAFSVSGGELATVSVPGGMTRDATWEEWYTPWEYSVGDVTVRQESARSGWLGITAEVRVDELESVHFFPNDSRAVTAVVTNCHADAYIDCTWSGGEGVTFSNPHSLTTTVSWHSTNTVSWATNSVDLVTTYEGGCAVTNHYSVTVGTQPEPTTTLTLDCPKVLFLNDDPLWDEEEGEWRGGSRTERVYRVTAKLLAPHGTSGTLSLDPEVLATVRLFEDRELNTPLATSRTLSVPVEGGYENRLDFYMSCPELGRGGITAVFTPTNDAPSVSTSAVFRVIEPLRRFVTKEKYAPTGQYVNPSRLVWGTNAVLKVDANPSGLFSPSEVTWSVVTTGACRIVRVDGWHAIVEPIVSKGTAIVEARFNGDAVQPRFVLPIVERRVIHVRAFKVSAPQKEKERNWKDSEIRSRFDLANQIFSQVGIEFDLHPDIDFAGTENDWVMKEEDVFTNAEHKVVRQTSAQARNLFSAFRTNSFVNVYFLGTISGTGAGFYYKPDVSIVISKDASRTAVAHELGHALGLEDCYAYALGGRLIDGGQFPLWRGMFETSSGQDWGLETQRGFYGIGDVVGDVIEDVLMYGVDSRGEDIPGCWVKGLRKKVKLNIPTDEIHVGADYIRKTDEEVYAK